MKAGKVIEEIVLPEIKSGYFTECYAACGSLNERVPKYSLYVSQADQRPLIFDLASLTKPLVTGPLIYKLIGGDHQSLDLPIRDFLPEPRNPDLALKSQILKLTFRELLGHYSGLPAWRNFWIGILGTQNPCSSTIEQREDLIARILGQLNDIHDKKDLYSDLGYILLGLVLEKYHSLSLSRQFSSFKSELMIDESSYFGFPTPEDIPSQFVSTGYCQVRKRVLCGEVHDENCAALGGVSGHAGLFGSGEGLVDYLYKLAQDKMGCAYLEANYNEMKQTQHDGLLGLRRGNNSSAKVFAFGESMGHLGFTGTAFWLDWQRKQFAVFLTNRVISGRVSSHIQTVRAAVFKALHDISYEK